ncbi:hypothetical protein [Cellvibrio japonicus]|uniref:hypothetical protein n=1 Tax=Cellvibrio japonicus TaxID=155077 RepID=UPI0002D3035B|nr:hypothetical protein [Cellvibrio japonicus]QEI10850.1 hypothetical protein FY117_00470 [Cellvibrio japonicus]QEI14426.1 hypothetical protein FY116_00470 [Cellvibrio japonicus]QEI18004.1 hypothetical protein FY115_00470 [Cellvibrio japonicus]
MPAPDAIELHLPVPQDHPCFADHFPGAPLVPGALLLKWIMALLAKVHSGRINYLKQIKFLAPVQPGDELRIHLTLPATPGPTMAIAAYRGETLVLKGQLGCIYD